MAAKTIERFAERATRLCEHEWERPEGTSALGIYVRRWVRWSRAGVSGPPQWPIFAPVFSISDLDHCTPMSMVLRVPSKRSELR